mmetsp:Transcript_9921/g.31495  ORF Transcript_9921/g.31495 Transcript_9921/m.31495 type:complete len:264 (-) Transcript_9921:183-974(-)
MAEPLDGAREVPLQLLVRDPHHGAGVLLGDLLPPSVPVPEATVLDVPPQEQGRHEVMEVAPVLKGAVLGVVEHRHTSVFGVPRHDDDLCPSTTGQAAPPRHQVGGRVRLEHAPGRRRQRAKLAIPGHELLSRHSWVPAQCQGALKLVADRHLDPRSLRHGMLDVGPVAFVEEHEHDLLHPSGTALGVSRDDDVAATERKVLLERSDASGAHAGRHHPALHHGVLVAHRVEVPYHIARLLVLCMVGPGSRQGEGGRTEGGTCSR